MFLSMQVKYPGIWNRIFLANKQVVQLGCSAGSIARYVTGAAARLSGLEIESEIYDFMRPGTYITGFIWPLDIHL